MKTYKFEHQDWTEYKCEDSAPDGIYVRLEDYAALQQRLAAAEAKIPKWISVNDRLPNIDGEVIVQTKHGEVCSAILNRDWWDPNEEYRITGVIKWMPMPEV